jgi:thiamine transport system ATP-binding protein
LEQAVTGADKQSIQLENVTYAWPDMPMHFDLALPQAGLFIVTGPSGSGKSTLLNLIAGFEQASGGRIFLGGTDMGGTPPQDRPVSFLFQDNNLFQHLTIEQNAGLALRPSLKLTQSEGVAVRMALGACGLEGKEGRLPSELSGGERQRAGLARVLLQDRPILLLDEPFAALGPALRAEMADLVRSIQRQKHMNVLAVTHHPDEWEDKADGFVFVDNGRILTSGAMNLLAKSGKELAGYLGDRFR